MFFVGRPAWRRDCAWHCRGLITLLQRQNADTMPLDQDSDPLIQNKPFVCGPLLSSQAASHEVARSPAGMLCFSR
jgi:hypothetical protein